MAEDLSGGAGPADIYGVSEGSVTGDLSASDADDPASEDDSLAAAPGPRAPARPRAHDPLEDDERLARLFERVRGPSGPDGAGDDSGITTDAVPGPGPGPDADADPDPGPASGSLPPSTRSRYAFSASSPPPHGDATRAAPAPTPTPTPTWSPPTAASRRRRVWPIVTVAAVVVVLAGAGVAYKLSKSSPDTGTALTSAVATTEQSKTAHVAMSMSLAAGGPTVTIAGNGDSDLAKSATNLTLAFSADGQPLTERAVIDGSAAYYNIGPLVGAVVPGKSWVSMNVGKSSPSSSSFGTGGIFTDPSTLIAVIGAPGTALHDLGSSVVNGSEVHRYSVNLGPAGIEKALSSETLPSGLRAELTDVHYSQLDYVVVVDGKNHVAQIRTTGAYSAAGEHFTVSSTMDLSEFGTPVHVAPPPASAVVTYQRFETIASRDQGTETT